MISEYATIELKVLQFNAHKRFSTALNPGDLIPAPPFQKRALDPANSNPDKVLFYERVNSQVVATWIQNTFTTQSFAKLLLKKKQFTFVDQTNGLQTFDGVIMLFSALTIFPDAHNAVASVAGDVDMRIYPLVGAVIGYAVQS